MAASFNAGFHGDTSGDLGCALCVDKFPLQSNGHHQLPGALIASHPLSMPHYNNNNGFYGNGSNATNSLVVGTGNISPDHNDGEENSSLLLADLLQTLNDATAASSPSPPIVSDSRYPCSTCDTGMMALYRCRDCSEVLCENCVQAHNRARMTKDHFIFRMSTHGSLPSPGDSTDSLGSSLAHSPPPPPSPLVSAPRHVPTPVGLMLRESEEAVELATSTANAVERRCAQVSAEIRALARRLGAALADRERDLLLRVERVRQAKTNALRQQVDSLRAHMRLIVASSAPQTPTTTSPCQSPPAPVAPLARHVPPMLPCEDDALVFSAPDAQAILNSLTTLGCLSSSGCADLTVATGDGLRKGIRGRPAFFTVRVADHLGEPRTVGREAVSAVISDQAANSFAADVQDNLNGSYMLSYQPHTEGMNLITVTLRGRQIRHSPFQAMIRTGRHYPSVGTPYLVFGHEGERDGELCRPWGVACDREGRFVVADRSNNRVQVFEADGRFSHKFGSQGCSPGQFDRPAGVTVDGLGRIVVADKDNHRLQVFTFEGVFLFKYGEKGSKPGQFNYPWDVDSDAESRVIVSDTRNHRVQMFDANGNFVCKYGFESASGMWKHFDSPRGVCWSPDQRVIVTDFNNHRLVVIEPDFLSARFLGCEGSSLKQFLRPQGVVVDDEGHIIVADSRNHRIQIFEQNGSFVWKFGMPGKDVGELDRPSGICLAPDGKIVVVDFGNNRIQTF